MSRKDELEDRLMGIVLQVYGEAEDRDSHTRFDPMHMQKLGRAFRVTRKRLMEWLDEYRKAIEAETPPPAKVPADQPKPAALNGTPAQRSQK